MSQKLTKRGGQLWLLKGQSTTGKNRGGFSKEIRVKHYAGSWEVHVSIAREDYHTAQASVALSADECETLVGLLEEAAEEARRFETSE